MEFDRANELGELRCRPDSAAGTGRLAYRAERFHPTAGCQLPDVLVRMTRESAQDVVEVSVGLHPQPLAGDHEREEIGRLLSAGLLADVQPVASSEHDAPKAVFG